MTTDDDSSPSQPITQLYLPLVTAELKTMNNLSQHYVT